MNISEKLEILADAAKYDASCASSGSGRKRQKGRLGNAAASGICHSFTEDGRCISLFKILFTNFCVFDCAYCVNRRSNDVPRAAFTIDEVVDLTINFYRRNFIEGLFLSSGVFGSPDATMEKLVAVARKLREKEGFNGYIHLKGIPGASPLLVAEAGRYADRLSVNIELASERSLHRLAEGKRYPEILDLMEVLRSGAEAYADARKRFRHAPLFAPAGQSTQLIIGASPETDWDVLNLANRLYAGPRLRRVYYSAFMPISSGDPRLPTVEQPPLVRENRLYQADWLLRLYKFDLREIIQPDEPHLDLSVDPKQNFARNHPHLFPIDINRADYEMLLRVPGLGIQSAQRILKYRKLGEIRYEHLRQMGVALNRAAGFIICPGHPGLLVSSSVKAEKPGQNADKQIDMTYDGSFSGLLTTIFEVYAQKISPASITPRKRQQLNLFNREIFIETDEDKATRVWKKLARIFPDETALDLHHAFLSSEKGVEMTILNVVREKISPNGLQASNRADDWLRLDQLSRTVRHEAHRMKGFVRFEATDDGVYLSVIRPTYDVLPLIRDHFEARFSDQRWMIVDAGRGYGLYYDSDQTFTVEPKYEKKRIQQAETTDDYTDLWRQYFHAINIVERRNDKLHVRFLPRRYWHHLPEKGGNARDMAHPGMNRKQSRRRENTI